MTTVNFMVNLLLQTRAYGGEAAFAVTPPHIDSPELRAALAEHGCGLLHHARDRSMVYFVCSDYQNESDLPLGMP